MSKLDNISSRKSVIDGKSPNRDRGYGRKDATVLGGNRSRTIKIFLESDKFNLHEVNSEFKGKRDADPKARKKTRTVVKAGRVDDFKSQDDADKRTEKAAAEGKAKEDVSAAPEKAKIWEIQEPYQNGCKKGLIEALISDKAQNLIYDVSLSRKDSCLINKPELKLSKSDYRKIQINEILKGHAQKYSKVSINSRDWMQQEMEFLTRGKIQQSPAEELASKKMPDVLECRGVVQKKKFNTQWIRYPQSKELESRLSGAWKNSLFFKDCQEEDKEVDTTKSDLSPDKEAPVKVMYKSDGTKKEPDGTKKETVDGKKTPDIKMEPKKKTTVPATGTVIAGMAAAMVVMEPKKVIEPKKELPEIKKIAEMTRKRGDEELKKVEKRMTYTDRIVHMRTMNKIGQKGEADSETDDEKRLDELKVVKAQKTGTELNLQVNSTFNKTLSVNMVKSIGQTPETIIKPRTSRSAELRDIVSQAARDHRIFCIFDNHWYIVRPVREELLNRGWLEVIPDRRLIPRRRPPPSGPVLERDKTATDRNCNTIEAILAAKELFLEELEETVAKSPTFHVSFDKPKPLLTSLTPTKKSSELSLKESVSLFRINPPGSEKKRNNFEIREFMVKCQMALNKEQEKEAAAKAAKERHSSQGKKSRDSGSQSKRQRSRGEEKTVEPMPLPQDLQSIVDAIRDGKKMHKALMSPEAAEEKEKAADSADEGKRKEADAETDKKSQLEKQPQTETIQAQKLLLKETEAKVVSKIIQTTNVKINFMWLSIKPAIHLKCFNYSPEIINKFQKTSFCTKIGLWNHLNNIQWYAHEVHAPAKSPRMYNTGEADDLQAFFQDFQLTACQSLLKWLTDNFFDRGIKGVQSKKGKVPLRAFEFAIKQCERYMRFKDNEDLSVMEDTRVLQEEWNTFLQWFYIIANDHGKLQESSSAQLMVVYTKAVETLRAMKKHWPEIDIDGKLNIWIMKPYCASCGRGIFMTNNVYYIGQHSKYIVQKYIEKPLLIYNTKFDIRQWFMITKLTPLEIWMYKECYLRFCSQPFALRNLHESVHLSNNSVQRKYVNRSDSALMDQNMWDSQTFQIYLNTIGHSTAWNEIIYPGMRDAIVSIMLAAQDNFDGPRRNWFEVYGADFMLSSNIKDGPWLIEINENPAMDPSTKVTARLCPQMLRDVIKVVVDKKINKNASTGQWELVYRQNYSPSFATVDLDVKGRKIARVPTAVKLEFNQKKPATVEGMTTEARVYEIVKCLSEEVSRTSVDEPVEPFNALNRDKDSFPIRSAKTLINNVILTEDVRTMVNGKNMPTTNPVAISSKFRLKKMKNFVRRDIKRKLSREHQLYQLESSANNKMVESDSNADKFKFTKFYKV